MGRRAAATGLFAPARTSVGSAIRFVASVVVLFGLVPVVIELLRVTDRAGTDGPLVSEWVFNAGAMIAGHLGWGLGVVATVQFGVLVAIVGGQMALGDQEQEAGAREFLLLLGVLPVAALAPAMLLLFPGATRTVDAGAALFVAVPVYLTMLAISVFIATFQPGPDILLLARAKRRHARAKDQVEELRGLLSLHPVVANAVGGAAGAVAYVVLPYALARSVGWGTPPAGTTVMLSAAGCAVAAFSAWILVLASASGKADPTWMEKVSAWVFSGLSLSMDLVMAVILAFWFAPGLLGVGAVVITRIVVIIVILCEAMMTQHAAPAPGRRWTPFGLVSQAGTHVAVTWADKELTSSAKHLAAMEEKVRRRAFPGQVPLF